MSWITATDVKYERNRVKPAAKRRTRGPRPRGPKPQVCDLCQLRKVKCDKSLPRCSLCERLNRPCTYDRNGFGAMEDNKKYTSSNSSSNKESSSPMVINDTNMLVKANETKFLWSSIKSPFLDLKKFKIHLHDNGSYTYYGSSMAVYFFTSASHLLQDIISNPDYQYHPVTYNKNIPVDITRTLVFQLVELYFGHLNSFFPLLDPTSFYSKLNGLTYDDSFQALLSAVCLSGSSFYPNRTFGRIIGIYFAKQVTHYLKIIYSKPTILGIQANLLASYYISLCEDDTMLENGWYYLGIARTMITMLGLPNKQPHTTKNQKELYIRLWWIAFNCESVSSNLFGRPSHYGEMIPLPKADSTIPTLTYTNPNLFIVKELVNLKAEDNSKYFREVCHHCYLVGRWTVLKGKLNSKKRNVKMNSMHSLSAILTDFNGNSISGEPLQKIKELEYDCNKWYIKMINLKSKVQVEALSLPKPNDIYKGYLSILHYSLLIDLNKPFIEKDMKASYDPPNKCLYLKEYYKCNPLERCITAAFFGTRTFMNIGKTVSEIGVPYIWYSSLQFIFIFIYIISSFDKNHWAVGPAKRNGYYLFNQFEAHSDKWVVIRDAFYMIKYAIPNGKQFFI
ncbi:hypothetical protein K502DRAFT_352609 [Neoconidiobolus thromboides FSU 785]|nr:hypothetical protein K502DRAFT_352609 [Neoconidiobolus thromboides FSU 785]